MHKNASISSLSDFLCTLKLPESSINRLFQFRWLHFNSDGYKERFHTSSEKSNLLVARRVGKVEVYIGLVGSTVLEFLRVHYNRDGNRPETLHVKDNDGWGNWVEANMFLLVVTKLRLQT